MSESSADMPPTAARRTTDASSQVFSYFPSPHGTRVRFVSDTSIIVSVHTVIRVIRSPISTERPSTTHFDRAKATPIQREADVGGGSKLRGAVRASCRGSGRGPRVAGRRVETLCVPSDLFIGHLFHRIHLVDARLLRNGVVPHKQQEEI